MQQYLVPGVSGEPSGNLYYLKRYLEVAYWKTFLVSTNLATKYPYIRSFTGLQVSSKITLIFKFKCSTLSREYISKKALSKVSSHMVQFESKKGCRFWKPFLSYYKQADTLNSYQIWSMFNTYWRNFKHKNSMKRFHKWLCLHKNWLKAFIL